jgi:hypothetical protein
MIHKGLYVDRITCGQCIVTREKGLEWKKFHIMTPFSGIWVVPPEKSIGWQGVF